MDRVNRLPIALAALLLTVACSTDVASAAATIGDVCRLKGQEPNSLYGVGLVIGLPGTGDSEAPTTRALARTLTLLGSPINPSGEDLKNFKNVAMVHVTATVDPHGGQIGGTINCRVSAFSAKSLEGGQLLACALIPRAGDNRVFAIAEGPITIEDTQTPTLGKVQFGAKLVRDVPNAFHSQNKVTLVLDDKHAGFTMAQEIEYAINKDKEFVGQELAEAIDAKTVVVRIPESYQTAQVLFVSALTSIPLDSLPRERRVVINERSGVIVIGDRVEIRPVAISHKSLTIEVGGERQSQFVPLSPTADTSTESLKSLVTALNTLRVPTEDMIEIIKTLDHEGALYGKLILQ